MNRDKIERHALYKFLSEVTGKKPKTIMQYFFRHKLQVTDKNAILNYLKMNTLQTPTTAPVSGLYLSSSGKGLNTKSNDDVCEHESDGAVYTSNPPQYRCKKCGTFY